MLCNHVKALRQMGNTLEFAHCCAFFIENTYLNAETIAWTTLHAFVLVDLGRPKRVCRRFSDYLKVGNAVSCLIWTHT